ncbi:uncharacterized protein LOC108665056 [Hyalella azteca]|uniref:Uncharacterized protein LOC108665056 n=1 Tax=Hyalella azteca TaxID=294128 RepID=A0A979FXD5_HYAAZ|nr:uncharacterized protein LOC108665056 [Hyalella azteca]
MNERIGCLQCTDIGVTYGDQDRRRVADVALPPKDTCCAQAANGYCLVAECDATDIGFCEAKTRCEARGLPMASQELYNNYSLIGDPTLLGTNQIYFWANIHRGEDLVWRWMPSMDPMGDVFFVNALRPDHDCAEMRVENNTMNFYSISCFENDEECALCYDPQTNLPAC